MSIPLPLYIKEPVAGFLQKVVYTSPRVAFLYAATLFAKDKPLEEQASKCLHQAYHQSLADWLWKKYGYTVVTDDAQDHPNSQYISDAPIWTFWWQGLSQAPTIVQRCIQSMQRHSNGHPVIVVTKENYHHYVKLPSHILEKVKNQKISITHFSDILRMNLLAEHGGLWLDSTIFVSQNIPECWFTFSLYTGRNPGGDFTNISDWNWTTYAFSAPKDHILPVFLTKFYYEYWKKEEQVLDYFLFDCAIHMFVEKNERIRQEIYSIPLNNTRQHDLDKMFYDVYDSDAYKCLLYDSDTYFHKLTWKASYPLKTETGEETAFDYWLNDKSFC